MPAATPTGDLAIPAFDEVEARDRSVATTTQQLPRTSSSLDRLIVVDLDGTLVKTDLLVEGTLALFKQNPLRACQVLMSGMKGRAALKRSLSRHYQPQEWLPLLRMDLVEHLMEQRAAGAHLILATASDQTWADSVAESVGIFDDVLGSDGTSNLKGPHKLAAIQAYCQANGYRSFCYAGDSRADLCLWEQADEVILAGHGTGLGKRLSSHGKPFRHFANGRSPVRAAIKSLRPHQWVKNLLIFLPLLLSHQVSELATLSHAILAFIVFSLAASAVYILNDVMDVVDDREHPKKKHRPFAAGEMPLVLGPPLSIGLLTVAFGTSMLLLPLAFTALLAVYITTTTLYSFWLKRVAVIDVIILASLYTLRIFAGGMATATPVSEWLMAFSMFIFLSLALSKRYAELTRLKSENKAGGRGYEVGDITLVETMGISSGFIAVLVMAMYVNSPNMKELYTHAWAVWAICPLILYWISRLWLLARRQQLSEDPVVFAIKDPVSWLVGAMSAALAWIAT